MGIQAIGKPLHESDEMTAQDLIDALMRIPEEYRQTVKVYAYDGGYDGIRSRVRRSGVDLLSKEIGGVILEPLSVFIEGDGYTTDW
jgi:hypothetical protein